MTRIVTCALALALLAAPAVAGNVCDEFLAHHLGDPAWEQECTTWLEAQQGSEWLLAAGTGTGGGGGAAPLSGGVPVEGPLHAAAADPSLAAKNQNEAFIAVDPANPLRVFSVSMTDPFDAGLLAAWSTDGGASWTSSRIGTGASGDGLPLASVDPWAVFTESGALFVSYIEPFDLEEDARLRVVVLRSGDGGQTFELVERLGNDIGDRESLATGPAWPGAPPEVASTLWVTARKGNRIAVEGAALDSEARPIVGPWCDRSPGFFCVEDPMVDQSGTGEARPGDVAVGPGGEVLVTYLRLAELEQEGPTRIYAALDPDGLGPAGFSAVPASGAEVLETNVGYLEPIPSHPGKAITPQAYVDWDRGAGGAGRIYLVSTSEEPDGSSETDIVLLTSDDRGESWSAPRRVNQDSAPEVRSQFFPHVAVDSTTGLVAVAWYDPRDDDGSAGRDAEPNTETELYVAFSGDGGRYFHELPVSAGFSFASSDGQVPRTHHGDYLGVAFHAETIHVAWADNSGSTGDNPDEGDPDQGVPHGCDPVPC